MRKKLITAIIALLILIAAAVGVIVYMETSPAANRDPESAATDARGSEPEATEETVGLDLPTEDPDEVTPEDSFDEDDVIPSVTAGSENSGETESPDANETPEDIF